MRKITIFCDRCGKQIDTISMWLHTFIYELPETEDADNVEEGAELCPDCYNEIDDMVAFMVKNPTIHFDGGKQIEQEKQKKTHGGDRKSLKLDLGKMAALRNAGWSYDKIAQEMHCSPQTVSNHIDEAQAFLKDKEVIERMLDKDIQEG